MLLVKILSENIDMEQPQLWKNSFHLSSTHFHMAIMSTCQYGCLISVTIPYFAGENLAMSTTSTLQPQLLLIILNVVGHVPLFLSKTLNKFLRLPGSYASCKVTGTRINREIGVGLDIPIEITFVGKKTATEWLKKALHHINRMNEEKVLKCKK